MKSKIRKICSKNIFFAKCISYILLVRDKFKKTNNYLDCKKFIKKSKLEKSIIKDVYFSIIYYKISSIEYFLYEFYRLNKSGRKEFVGEYERNEIIDNFKKEKLMNLMKDKYATYGKFKEYYKREMVMIKGNEDYDKYKSFYNNHKQFIAKPYNEKAGQGVLKIFKDYETYWNDFISKGIYVLEEFIVEDDELLSFHPQSVNTVRFVTFNKNGEVYNAFAFFRMGIGNSVVDNIGAGGISAAIDLETGIITLPGKDEDCNKYIIHPDTKKQIVGYKIPKWDELLKTVKELSGKILDYPYISWDFALTSKGWVLIEVNSRGSLYAYQMHGIGLRDKIKFLTK